MPIDALCFDLDDTLLDTGGTSEALRGACEVLIKASPGLNTEQILAANKAAWAAYIPEVEQEWVLGQIDTASIGLEVWRRTLQACGCDEESLAVLAQDTLHRLQCESYCLFEDVLACFECLAVDLPVVLITNGASDLQREKIRLLDLESRFKLIVVSGEHGVAKPDPAVFKVVLEHFALREPRKVWHIGDNLISDVGGAKAAGLTAVWLNRAGFVRSANSAQPDHEISSLSRLRELMAASQ